MLLRFSSSLCCIERPFPFVEAREWREKSGAISISWGIAWDLPIEAIGRSLLGSQSSSDEFLQWTEIDCQQLDNPFWVIICLTFKSIVVSVLLDVDIHCKKKKTDRIINVKSETPCVSRWVVKRAALIKLFLLAPSDTRMGFWIQVTNCFLLEKSVWETKYRSVWKHHNESLLLYNLT